MVIIAGDKHDDDSTWPPAVRCAAGTTLSHYHVEVVTAFKRRLDQRHAACGAYVVPFGPTGHHCIADRTQFEMAPDILVLPVRNPANKMPR